LSGTERNASSRHALGLRPGAAGRSSRSRSALQTVAGDGFDALACLADEWQQVVDEGLGNDDLTIVTRALGR